MTTKIDETKEKLSDEQLDMVTGGRKIVFSDLEQTPPPPPKPNLPTIPPPPPFPPPRHP